MLAEVTRQIAQAGKREVEVGNLWPLRDYIDVESMAAVIVDATSAVEGLEILNVGSGNAVEVSEALRILTSVLPFTVTFKSGSVAPAAERPPSPVPRYGEAAQERRTCGRVV
jgi:UDP-glucose 4-epimerase